VLKNIIKSPVKWPGGKSTLLTRLSKHIPMEGYLFVEAFAGGCSVALNTNYSNYIINDLNGDLIGMYKDMVNNRDLFLEKTLELFNKYNNPKDYYKIRTKFNTCATGIERSAMFMYLNRHGYKGLVRYSKKTGFNVPFGGYKKPYFPEEEVIFFSEKFKDATFTNLSFVDLFKQYSEVKSPRATVFADPPYLPLTKTAAFVNYTASGFTKAEHIILNHELNDVSLAGGKGFLTNHKVSFIHDVYSDAKKTFGFKVKRSISAKAKRHKKAPEVLLVY
jgi:DNA adenine methylase